MRILISSNTAWYIWNFRLGFIKEALKRNAEIFVLAPQDEYADKLKVIGCNVLDIKIDNKGNNLYRDLTTFFSYYRIIKRVNPDVVFLNTIKPVIYGTMAASMLAKPIVNTITGLGTAFIKDTWLTRIVEFLYSMSLKRSTHVFFQNPDDKALFLKKRLLEPCNTSLMPGSGVNIDTFRPATNLAEKGVFILVARLLADKGVREFVEAARLVKDRFPECRFQLLGPVEVENRTAISKDELDLWVKTGVIEYLGVTDDVRPYMNKASCVVLPSYREGLPRTLLEAGAMSKPLIATDVPGCRVVVRHGINGFLCKDRNAIDLRDKIIDFLSLTDKERFEMGALARDIVVNEFSERIVVHNYFEIIDNLRSSN
ncbi:glycosyltransferase family 4 protein [Marinobacterium jannaschii]|uniref:glycosyltransferase family 4 protein n=1 Tax=Marinobacterium jannaschii TaxID=64970 RepID=UPI000689140E|nr:glycosyltransferase family 4 protein [Marinobacterium jannaschii]